MVKGKYKRTKKHRELIGKRYLGKKLSEQHKKNISLGTKGRKLTKEHKNKIGLALRGRIFSKESKLKMSLSKKGKPSSKKGKHFSPLREKTKLKISKAMKGRKFSEETIKKMSLAQSREKHPNWQGGISLMGYPTNFNNKFKRAIRKRDNYVCMLCGKHQEKEKRSLDVHHINYDKELTIKENCITLCRNCHAKTNRNKKSWINFFQYVLSNNYNYQYKENFSIINLELKNE